MIFGDRESSVAMTRLLHITFFNRSRNGGGYMHFVLRPPLVVYDMQVGIVKQIENGPQIADRGFLRHS
jgi:hypothetical protein